MIDEFFLQEHAPSVEEELLRCAEDVPILSSSVRHQAIGAALTAHRRAWMLERTQVAAAVLTFLAVGMLLSGHYLIQFGVQYQIMALASQDNSASSPSCGGNWGAAWENGIPSQAAMYAEAVGSDEWTLVEISNDYRARNLHILKTTFWE